MLIFGLFFLIGENVNYMLKEIESEQGMQVFMEKDATEEQIKKLGEELQKLDYVAKTEFVSKEEDLKMEAKVQETEFSLFVLVKRLLDFVRGSDSIRDRNENEGTQTQENDSVKLSKSPNLLTDGNVNGNQ